MSANVSKTLIRDARKHLKSNMSDTATIKRTNKAVPCLVVVQRWAVPMKGVMESRIRTRKWNILMPPSPGSTNPDSVWAGTDVREGDRVVIPNHGTFMVLEVTDPNTYNAATSVWACLTNAVVSFSRPEASNASTGEFDCFVQRISDEEKTWGVDADWECWYGAEIVYPNGTQGGVLPSQGDEIEWDRSPNQFINQGTAVLDNPRWVYGQNGNPVVSVTFKEPK